MESSEKGAGKLNNKKDVDTWLFEMQKKKYTIRGIQGIIDDERVNVYYECRETGERKYLHWSNGVLG